MNFYFSNLTELNQIDANLSDQSNVIQLFKLGSAIDRPQFFGSCARFIMCLCGRSDMICTICDPMNVCRKREHFPLKETKRKTKSLTFHGRIQVNRQDLWQVIRIFFYFAIMQSFLWHVRIFAPLYMNIHRIKNCRRRSHSPQPCFPFFAPQSEYNFT